MLRGDVYRLSAPRDARDHEQRGARYAVVVQGDAVASSTVVVVPTSRSTWSGTTHPTIELGGERTQVMPEQVQAVAPSRLGRCVGRTSLAEQRDIDEALLIVLGLDLHGLV